MDSGEIAKAFGAFFAIMNPFVNLPIFLSLTSTYSVSQQRTLATKVAIICAAMCAIILLVGDYILSFFGITIDQFRIAGGIVLGHISWSMLNGASAKSHHGNQSEKDRVEELSSLAFYPIAFPMIVGPGTIATLIIYASHADQLGGLTIVAAVVAAVLAILFFVLFFSASVGKLMSETMRSIMARIMGMILLSVAVEMIVAGGTEVFPGLGR